MMGGDVVRENDLDKGPQEIAKHAPTLYMLDGQEKTEYRKKKITRLINRTMEHKPKPF